MYTYNASVVRVIDGDTVELDVDLGFYVRHTIRVRLADIDAPEHRGETLEAGVAATNYLKSLLPKDTECIISTGKTDKYGRWVAVIYIDNDSVNAKMVAAGHAVGY